MWNFWTGILIGWVLGELGLCLVIALVSDRDDRRARRAVLRAVERDDDDEARGA